MRRPQLDIPWSRWQPKLVDTLRGYDRSQFYADVGAGLTVGLVALPLALAFGIASGVTPLLSAVVADGMVGDRHSSEAELLAQGVANIVVPLVGGTPVTGAIARTATNFRAGARTPVAGMIHALTLAAVVLVFAKRQAS